MPIFFTSTFHESHNQLSCRTEKDRRQRLNHRTAGIKLNWKIPENLAFLSIGVLAGMWPCGVITSVCELFLSESKSQVYGHLHDFLKSAPETASHLSKLHIYFYKDVYVII